jgi:hypothetical protein
MVLVAYSICEEVGIANQINEKKVPLVEMRDKIVVTIYESYRVSLLKKDGVKDIKIYRGVMKKSALDEMDHIKSLKMDFSPNTTVVVVEAILGTTAKRYGANIVIIDNHTTRIERRRIYGSDRDSSRLRGDNGKD